MLFRSAEAGALWAWPMGVVIMPYCCRRMARIPSEASLACRSASAAVPPAATNRTTPLVCRVVPLGVVMEKLRSWNPKRVIPGEERLTSRSKARPKSALLNGRTINNDSAAYARLSSPDSRNTRIPTRRPRATQPPMTTRLSIWALSCCAEKSSNASAHRWRPLCGFRIAKQLGGAAIRCNGLVGCRVHFYSTLSVLSMVRCTSSDRLSEM